jgi:hypothetical protein
MIPINIKKIRVQPILIETSDSLSYGSSVVLGVMGSVIQIVGSDNQDGTQNVTYTVKPENVQIDKITESLDRKTVATTENAGKSRSKQLRAKAYRIAQNTGESPDALYNSAIDEASNWLDSHEASIIIGEMK